MAAFPARPPPPRNTWRPRFRPRARGCGRAEDAFFSSSSPFSRPDNSESAAQVGARDQDPITASSQPARRRGRERASRPASRPSQKSRRPRAGSRSRCTRSNYTSPLLSRCNFGSGGARTGLSLGSCQAGRDFFPSLSLPLHCQDWGEGGSCLQMRPWKRRSCRRRRRTREPCNR